MSAPQIWILFPLIAAAILYPFRRWEKAVAAAGTIIASGLAFLAWKTPLEVLINLGPWYLRIDDTFFVLGRRFVIDPSDQPIIALLFLAVAFWLGGAYFAQAGRSFVPFGLAITAVFVAGLTVEPFLYSALLIQMAALLCIPLLASPGRKTGPGTLRFLTFYTLGTPFLLFTGWMLAGSEVTPPNMELVLQAGILLALGFCFLLAVFPFHSWIPMLTEDTHPYAAAFVFFLLPGFASLVGLGFLERYAWLRNSPNVYLLLQAAGVLLIFTAGLSAAFQKHLGRILGYAVLVDIGMTLLVISIAKELPVGPFLGSKNTGISLSMFIYLFITKGLALGLWALALSNIKAQAGDLSYRTVQGMGRSHPFTALGIVLGTFSIAGFPLLAGFPVRLALFEVMAPTAATGVFWAALGSAGLIIAGFRSLAVLVMGQDETFWQVNERLSVSILITIASAVLFVVGIAPHLLR
jgi:NADH-quinone oxidoreductase subunit N